MDLITTTEELAATCERLARHPFVTIDTEFLRETTYYPLLCVAQMASSDEAVVIDALAPGIDLKPFFELMANEKVLKVFHAARQDIEIVWHRANIIPHPIFDTQVAAMVLGHGEFDLLRPARAAHHRRHARQVEPLHRLDPPAAVDGPAHLCGVRRHPSARRLSRRWSPISGGAAAPTGWTTRWRSSPRPTPTAPSPSAPGCGCKTRVRKPKELAVLIEVAAWREREAQTRDVPRSRVLKDDTIGDIAVQAPTTAERLAALRSLPKGFERSKWGEGILEAVQRGLARDPKTLPQIERPKPAPNGAATVELLKVLLRMTSERHGVAAKVIATVDDLDRIAADDEADVPALKGWRRELFGEKALDLKHGRLGAGDRAQPRGHGRPGLISSRSKPSEQVRRRRAGSR